MAGDWIKVEHWTPDKPEVFRIADRLKIDPDAVVGKLVRIWIWADQQTTDGNAPSVTKTLLDRVASVNGFADAMISARWLEEVDDGVQFVNFDRHNGQTSKMRAQTAKRVKKSRFVVTQMKRDCNGESVTEALPEKRREEKSIKEPPTPFQGDASRSSENASADVDATEKPKRVRKGPTEAVTREVLRDTAKLVRWWRFASNCGLVDGTENSRLNVVGVACQVLASEAVRDPVAVFVATVRDKAWDRIGEAADEQARRRLKDFDAGKRAGNVAPEIAAALGKLAAAKASRATAEDLAAYGDGDCDE